MKVSSSGQCRYRICSLQLGAGDPLEVSAIASCFDRRNKSAHVPLYIGSVKPNIGHLEAGAGLAGLIKTILTLEAGVIPPNINFETANPKLRLDDYNFVIAKEPTLWPTHGLRRASVNSFGYGGKHFGIVNILRQWLNRW